LRLGVNGSEFGDPFPSLVCEDIGSEVADFIGVDNGAEPRIVFVAAKWGSGNPGAGASGLYDICGQALKNLAYLKTDGLDLPGAPRRWDKDWTLNGGKVPRRRAGPGSTAFRTQFREAKSKPATRRAVWLVLGGGILSKSKVESEFRKPTPQAHVLQLFHLLLSVHSTCQSVGVELKIFCVD